MITRELLRTAAATLKHAGCDSPRLDAELLLAHVWKVKRTDLIVRSHNEVPAEIATQFDTLLQRRSNREPLAYIIGEKEFWSRPFQVTPDVLIPRPETEHLIEAVLNRFPDKQVEYRFCDIGTGSGCIAVTLACEFPNATIVATDISEAALRVAKKNAARHTVVEHIVFRNGDMLNALEENDGPFDAIISNPPYVALDEMKMLEPELAHEPDAALTDNRDGLYFLNNILREGSSRLTNRGFIMVETGLCGLPEPPAHLKLETTITDLAGQLRGGIYRGAS